MSFLKGIFGSSKQNPVPQVNYTPQTFSGGGLSSSYNGNDFSVAPSAGRSATVGGLTDTFANFGNATGDLRSTVAPGFNDMLKARLTDLSNQGAAAIGNLKQNLQSRRILGSSFGQDTLSRANNTIQQQRDAVIADNFQKSLEANNQLLTQQYGAYAKQYQTGLDELNLESGLASNLATTGSQILAQNAQAQAKMTEQNQEFKTTTDNSLASGFGKVVGGLGSIALAPFTGGASLAALPLFSGVANRPAAA